MVLSPVTCWSAGLWYDLDVRVDTAGHKIYGKARLNTDEATTLDLAVKNLWRLNVDGVAVNSGPDQTIRLKLKEGLETVVSYEAVFPEPGPSLINSESVFLMESWYPAPDTLAQYELTVVLPREFTAISEADTMIVEEAGLTKSYRFQFKHPLDALHLVASTRFVVTKESYNDISIEAYFFKEDADLAETYLDYTRKYLALYEKMLTPYPYKRFAIVESVFPSGNSLPGFTLLGREVVRLPFIVKTSLGHEILHQWFGNSVYVDFLSGNWCEGITNYLADHHYAVKKNQDRAYRKQIMLDYSAYVNPDNAIPLGYFRSRQNRAQGVIGYGKGAMLFHELKDRYGEIDFLAALRDFIRRNRFRRASWHDIQHAFEKITGDKLYSYFGDWLTRSDIPDLGVADAEIVVEGGELLLEFILAQKGEPYSLRVPLTIFYHAGSARLDSSLLTVIPEHENKVNIDIDIKHSEEKIRIPLAEPPARVVIDQDYSIMRQLHSDEIPPVLASVMGCEKLTVAIAKKDRSKYKPLIDALGIKNIAYVNPNNVTFKMMEQKSFLFAGFDNGLADKFFGKQHIPDDGVRLKVYKNSYDTGKRILLAHVRNKTEARAVSRKLSHYGKYSELAFNNGKNTGKIIAAAKNGIPVISSPATRAVKPDRVAALDDIMPEISSSRVVYVGERHDQYAHHLNQLKIIRSLHSAGLRIGVGMEMFQAPYQPVIDDYLAGRIDEHTFLKKTGYFNNWRFDYNLYKPIIDYLKQNRIPLVALNIKADIFRRVARKGIDGLSKRDKKQIPQALDFSVGQYRCDLHDVFEQHDQQAAIKNFNYFFQAQVLWDEGMAEAAHKFLTANPGLKLVVLAGNGHIRNKYGIPERLYRRRQAPYTVIVQDEDIEPGIADYVLFTSRINGNGSPKLGVAVVEEDQQLAVKSVRAESPAGNIGVKPGDIITGLAGQTIKTLADLKLALFYHKSGDKVTVRFKRNGKDLEKEIELSGSPWSAMSAGMKKMMR